MEASYPISMIFHSIALNITCQSYADGLAFAFVGCRDSLPHLQNLAVYTADALNLLEAALKPARTVKPAKGTVRRAPRKKAAAARKAGTGKHRKRPTPGK